MQTGLESVDYLCLAADGSHLAVSQISGGREVWSSMMRHSSLVAEMVAFLDAWEPAQP